MRGRKVGEDSIKERVLTEEERRLYGRKQDGKKTKKRELERSRD